MPPPARPRFVLITIAPLAASMPYSAAASGPFSTVSVSMSCEFRSAARLVKSTPRLLNAVTELLSDASTPVLAVRLSIGRPSTMISGGLPLLLELIPRMARDGDAASLAGGGGDGVIALGIGRRRIGGALHRDGHTGQRSALLARDPTSDRFLLCEEGRSDEERDHQYQNGACFHRESGLLWNGEAKLRRGLGLSRTPVSRGSARASGAPGSRHHAIA